MADNIIRIPLVAVAEEPGDLRIEGVRIRLPDGQTEILPLLSARSSGVIDDRPKGQRPGKLPAGPASRPSVQRKVAAIGQPHIDRKDHAILCQIIPSQPLMWVRGTNLNHGSLMSLDGET